MKKPSSNTHKEIDWIIEIVEENKYETKMI